MAESEEKLKSLLMGVKEESEKCGLKRNNNKVRRENCICSVNSIKPMGLQNTHTHTEKWDRRGEELVMKEEIQNLTFSAT